MKPESQFTPIPLYKLLFDRYPDGVLLMSPTGQLMDANPAIYALLGYTQEELSWLAAGSPAADFHASLLAVLAQRDQDGSFQGECLLSHKNGALIPCEIHCEPLPDAGTPAPVMIRLRKIAEQKQLEDQLQHCRQNYQTLVESCPYVVARLNRELRLIYLNRPLAQTPVDELLGKTWSELHSHFENYESGRDQLLDIFHTGKATTLEGRYRDSRGITRYFHFKICPEYGDTQTVTSLLIIIHETTKEKQLEERFCKAFRKNPSMMAIISLTNRNFIDVNESFIKTVNLPYGEIIGKQPHDIGLRYDKKKAVYLQTSLEAGKKIHNYQLQITTKEARTFTVLISAEIITLGLHKCALTTFTDITEIKELKFQVARLDILNIIGKMAASIGHEVRNPLTTVRGYLQMFHGKDYFRQYHDQLATMISELDRANQIITEYLSLAKAPTFTLQRGNLNQILHSLQPLLQTDALQSGHDLEIITEPVPDILCNEKEIRQLLLNLVKNGLEAMAVKGSLTIRTYTVDARALLSIQDQGTGIDPYVLDNLGTPFLTTKEEGTGLGLSVCYHIAEKHRASIDIHSTPDGTTFFISFPVLE